MKNKPKVLLGKMKKDVEDYIKSCKHCQLTKRAQYNNQADEVLIHLSRTLGERIDIEHVGPLPASTQGFKYAIDKNFNSNSC